MKPLGSCRLYAFVDTAYLKGRAPADIAQQLCDGGADLIQLRAKGSSREEIRRMAETILPRTTRARVGLVINDFPGLAQELNAEFCHLGQEDFFETGYNHVAQVFKPAPKPSEKMVSPRIGLSTHSAEQALKALAAGAHYIAVGPVYATGTKPGVKPVTVEYVQWAAAHVNIPWFAIGGITLENIGAVLDAGATRVCVVSAILNAPDISVRCREFKARLETA